METLKSLIRMIVLSIIFTYSCLSQIPLKIVNTIYDDRAIAFRYFDTNQIEVWRTVGGDFKNKYSKALEKTGDLINFNFVLDGSLNRNQIIDSNITLDGCISFPYFSIYDPDLNWAVFASNRLVNGLYKDNDIYEVKITNNGSWTINRIDNVCSDYYDDTPALSPDGKVLYFSSTRNNPISGKTDLYYSIRNGDQWSFPIYLKAVNSDYFNETSPFVGLDGYLYYSTDREGDYDIWRVKLDDNFLPVGSPEKLEDNEFPNVNLKGSDEFSPTFSIGGNFFFFSSNRKLNNVKGHKDFDIYYIPIQKKDLLLVIDVKEQKRIYGTPINYSKPDIPIAEEIPCPSELNIKIESNPKYSSPATFTSSTDTNGHYEIVIPRININLPLMDLSFRKITLKVNSHCCPATPTHTLKLDLNTCGSNLYHKVIVFCEKDIRDSIPLITDTIPFFVTGYWCPSSKEFQDLATCSCISKLLTECSPNIDTVTFWPNCEETNELFSYNVVPSQVVPKVVRSRNPYACIDLKEMMDIKSGKLNYFSLVDSLIKSLIQQMRDLMKNPYIQQKMSQNKMILIEVYGWTDWRPLDKSCMYTGDDIDLNDNPIQIEPTIIRNNKVFLKTYIKNGIIAKGTKFRTNWNDGNQLLSDLRAYYTAQLLDKLWMTNVPEYRDYRDKIKIIAIGRSIRNIPNIPLALNRSIDVLVRLNAEETVTHNLSKPFVNPDLELWLCKPFFLK